MWSVDQPDFEAEATFTKCISRIRDAELKGRLTYIGPNITAAADEYVDHAEAEDLHLVPQSNDVAGLVTKDEMIAVYNVRMVGTTSPGRSIYTAIKLLPEHDRCPFCGHRDVTTLDHVLPKTLYPALAVAPLNLVGCCRDCNTSKRDVAPTCASDMPLHPYFDDLSGHTWLRADVVARDPCAVLFRVSCNHHWSDELCARLDLQFRTLGLAKLYSQQAAREMSAVRRNLIRIFESSDDGAEAVREELDHQWQSRRDDRRNSWQTAMYCALSKNDWYCDEGFRLGLP